MELLAVAIMILAGGAAAVIFLVGFSIARAEREGTAPLRPGDHDEVAASLLYQVLVSGGMQPDEALRELRRTAHLAARVTPSIDVASWGDVFARNTTPGQRAHLLDTAVQLAAQPGRPIPLRQYCTLLDLSFALGYQTDALARLREQYGFEYVDHAKDARPRDADRSGGATALFVREPAEAVELLRVLEIEGTPTRQQIISAYRRLVSQHHPDRHYQGEAAAQESAAARFIEITRAYEKLIAIYRD